MSSVLRLGDKTQVQTIEEAMKKIAIVGSSGHAKVIVDIVQQQGECRIVGLLDRNRKAGEAALGFSVLGSEENLPKLKEEHGFDGVIVAIGDNHVRGQVVKLVREKCPDIQFPSAIHPRACVAPDVALGEGSVIMPGVCVNPGSCVGNFCIINTNASLDHDSVLGDFASLAPGVVTGGDVRIGQFSVVGIGAVLNHAIELGEQTVIGAGAVVTGSLPARVVAYGVPAKVVRSREPGDRYL